MLRPFLLLRKIESSEERLAIFQDIARRSPLIRVVQFGFLNFRHTLAPLMVSAYAAAAFVRISYPRTTAETIIAAAEFENEAKELREMFRIIGAANCRSIGFGLSGQSASSLIQFIHSLHRSRAQHIRAFRIIRRMAAAYPFLTACRCASFIGFYCRMRQEMAAAPPRAVLVASPISPRALSLTSAAKGLCIPSIFSSHAMIPPKDELYRPATDLVLLDGPAALKACGKHARSFKQVIFKGLTGSTRPLRVKELSDASPTIGFFLTAPLNQKKLEEFVAFLAQAYPSGRVVLRPHPVAMLTPDLSYLKAYHPALDYSLGKSLDESLAPCDVVISSNSNVHLDVLRRGVPCVYFAPLDYFQYDHFGFVSFGVVPAIGSAQDFSLDKLQKHYSDPAWPERFRFFDGAYLEDEQMRSNRVRRGIESFLASWNSANARWITEPGRSSC